MKILIAFIISVAALAAADLPRGAVQTDDGSYRYTDAHGTKWIYRKTPFGMARAEDVTGSSANVTAKQKGDVIQFERPTPFGPFRWERKQADLNESEKAVWNREEARTAKKD